MANFDYVYTSDKQFKFKVRKTSFLKKSMKFLPFISSCLLTGFLAYNFHTTILPEIKYDLRQKEKEDAFESALNSDFYDLESLTDVDMSKKTVCIDIFIEPDSQTLNFEKNKNLIFQYVSDFYSRQNINLIFKFLKKPSVQIDNRVNQTSIEILKFDSFLNRAFELCEFETVDEKTALVNKFFGNLEKENKYVAGMYHREKNDSLILSAKRIELNRNKQIKIKLNHNSCNLPNQNFDLFNSNVDIQNLSKAHVIAHELGHAFGLSETNEFLNDSATEYVCEFCKIPNLMSYKPLCISKKSPIGGELNNFQIRMMHSYLSKGRVYKQFELVDFDSNLWSFAVKKTNVYFSQNDLDEFEENKY